MKLRVRTLGLITETPDGYYCSPACGGGCTKAGYDRAVVMATALAESLGPGWTPDVSENLGWHWRATCGERSRLGFYPAEVSGNADGSVTAFLRVNPDIHAHGPTGPSALSAALEQYGMLMDENLAKVMVVNTASKG